MNVPYTENEEWKQLKQWKRKFGKPWLPEAKFLYNNHMIICAGSFQKKDWVRERFIDPNKMTENETQTHLFVTNDT